MGSGIRDFETDLLYLHKDTGCAPGRSGEVGTLCFFFGGDDLPYADVCQRLLSVIGALHDQDAAFLLDAFTFGSATEGLSTLRASYLHQRVRDGRTSDAVVGHETKIIAKPRNQLLTAWYPTSPMPPSERVSKIHNSIVREKNEILCIVEDDYWQQTQERYRFPALFGKAVLIRISNSFPGTVIPKPPIIVRSHKPRVSGSRDVNSQNGPMRRDQICDLHHSIRPAPELEEDRQIRDASRIFRKRALTNTFEVVFIGAKPETIRCFEALTYFGSREYIRQRTRNPWKTQSEARLYSNICIAARPAKLHRPDRERLRNNNRAVVELDFKTRKDCEE